MLGRMIVEGRRADADAAPGACRAVLACATFYGAAVGCSALMVYLVNRLWFATWGAPVIA